MKRPLSERVTRRFVRTLFTSGHIALNTGGRIKDSATRIKDAATDEYRRTKAKHRGDQATSKIVALPKK